MTNKNLDKCMAEIMGWVYEQGSPYRGTRAMWCLPITDEARCGLGQAFVDEWHPPESISDAFQVVEKMIEKGFAFQLFCNMGTDSHIVDNWVSAFFKPFGSGLDAIAETIPLSICLAAKKAIEGVE